MHLMTVLIILGGRFAGTREEDPYWTGESQEKAGGRSETCSGVYNGSGKWEAAAGWKAQKVGFHKKVVFVIYIFLN